MKIVIMQDMKVKKMGLKADIIPNNLPSYFLDKNGAFNLKEALRLSGHMAGVCYDEEGFAHIVNEPASKTKSRINITLENGHHSVYDHINISFNLQNIPKMLAMVLNNEHQYTTSEKSARYTPVVRGEDSIITATEEKLYNKWLKKFIDIITKEYSQIKMFNSNKIKKLAQENARYLVTVFMPTQMVYTTSLRQINYLTSWMFDYIENVDMNSEFERKLAGSMQEFTTELLRRGVLVDELTNNEKHRKLSLFGKDLDKKEIHFGDTYSTTYEGTFAQLAQAQRHRTLDYQMEFLSEKKFFVPPILMDKPELVAEWLRDMEKVKNVYPQGQIVRINEIGKYEDFILKCKERLCTNAQLEIMQQTKSTLDSYKSALEESGSPLASDIEKYSHGARCTFPDFDCASDCGFKEGKLLTRKI